MNPFIHSKLLQPVEWCCLYVHKLLFRTIPPYRNIICKYFVHSSSVDLSLLMCTYSASLFYFAFFHVTENCMTLRRNISLKMFTAMVLIIDGVAADVTRSNVRWSWWRRLWVSMRARRFACAAIANHSLAACTAPFAPRFQAGSDESDPEMYTVTKYRHLCHKI